MKYLQTQRGYTLLFSVITAALVLGVAGFILSVSRKQLMLSSASRESMNALYAADSGIECMAGNKEMIDHFDNAKVITCNGSVSNQYFGSRIDNGYELESGITVPAYYSSDMWFDYDPGCAKVNVVVIENVGSPPGNPNYGQIVQSRGYNLCVDGRAPAVTPKIVERALEVRYNILP